MKRMRRSPESVSSMLMALMVSVLVVAGMLSIAGYLLLAFLGLMANPFFSIITMPMMMAFLAMMFALGLGRTRLKPINNVVQAMHEVSQGDFSVRVDEEANSEDMRQLARSFNEMAAELGSLELFRKDFINNFSHEFKTPIVSVRGFAKQLERDDLTDEQRREYLEIIVSESDRLANMASNVLLLTKLENQTIVTDKTEYSLDEQIRSCLLLLEKQWTEKNIDLDLEMDEAAFYGNEEMVAHIWVNLIGNAIKFSPEGAVLHIRLQKTDDACIVRIRDEGEGMDEDTRARIFEKFWQGDTAHATEGNGLGLSLVKRIVDLCGGGIAVESAPGRGSTFSVTLPNKK